MAIFSTWFGQRPNIGVLKKGDGESLEALFREYRAVSCFPMAWVERYGITSRSRRGTHEFIGASDGSRMLSMALIVGQSLVALVGEQSARELGEFSRGRIGELRTVVGTEAAVGEFLRGARVYEDRLDLLQPQHCLEADAQHLVVQELTLSAVECGARDHVARMRAATRSDTFPFLQATLSMYEEETGLRLSRHEIEAFEISVKHKIRDGRAWIIYDDGGQLVFKAGIGLPTKSQAHLEGVYVTPEFRRQGIGRLAMQHLCSKLALRYETISLIANEENAAALSLYHGIGFKRASGFATAHVRS